jgi:hypothetical protein
MTQVGTESETAPAAAKLTLVTLSMMVVGSMVGAGVFSSSSRSPVPSQGSSPWRWAGSVCDPSASGLEKGTP